MSQQQDSDGDARFAPKVEIADDIIAEALAAVERRLTQEPEAPEAPPPRQTPTLDVELDPRLFENTIPPDDGDEEGGSDPEEVDLVFDPGVWGEPPPSAVDHANARVKELEVELDTVRTKLRETREKGRRLNERHVALLQSWQQLRTEYDEVRASWIRHDKQLAELRAEAKKNDEDRERLKARHARELEEGKKFAVDKLLKELLPVLDNLDIALPHTNSSPERTAEGLRMIASQLVRTLERFGVERIVGAAGGRFDPHQHEAIAYQPSTTVPAGHILECHQGGWSLNGRLVRPARVSVARAEAQAAAPEAEPAQD